MMSFRSLVILTTLIAIGSATCSGALAQSPGPVYTWDHAYGDSIGPNIEGWAVDFGGNAIALDNLIDGALTITETDQQDWAIRDSFNRIRESSAPNDFGGIDLTGLSSIEIVIGHNGLQTFGGQVYAHTPNGPTNCCDFDVLGGFSVAPGAPQVVSVPLTGLTADKIAWVRTIGIQIFDHTWDAAGGPLTWTINEVRSAGTPLYERYLSPHNAPNDLDGAVVKFDSAAISGGADDSQNGLSVVANDSDGYALRWVDLGGGPGAAIAWGNGRDGILAVDYHTRPTDLSNYKFVEVRMRAQGGAGADPTVGVQFYVQTTDAYQYQSAGNIDLPVDSTYHSLVFSLAGLVDMDGVQWHGINVHGHAGNMDLRVDFVRFFVPEPTTLASLLIGFIGAAGGVRRRRQPSIG